MVASNTEYSTEDMESSESFADRGVDPLTNKELMLSCQHLSVADVTSEFTTTDEISGFAFASQTPPFGPHKDDDLAKMFQHTGPHREIGFETNGKERRGSL